jgi:expansin (peptidoglycan-binding protein)
MGSVSNGNPYCGVSITIMYGTAQVVVKAVDKCPECTKYSIDLSPYAFGQLCDLGVGRTQAKWYFNTAPA